MRVIKKSTHHLSKCYSIALLQYNDKEHILVAAEKTDACLMFDLCGNMEEVIWDQPGGTMSMVQFPNSNGVFLATHQFYSPNDSKEAKIVMASPEHAGKWQVIKLLDHPVSDMTLVDFDGDGELEMVTISPFHGDRAAIYKRINGTYEEIYVYKKPIPFAHGIWSGELCGEPTVVLGHRQGERNLIAITCIDKKNLIFAEQKLDHNVGTANVLHYKNKNKAYLVAANRD